METPYEVLVVEDSRTQAEQLRFTLEKGGYRVRTAASGKEALRLLTEHPAHVVVSDIVMEEIDGYRLCRTIKDDPRFAGIPVILLTSLSETEDVIRGLESGADNFITKPYDAGYLLSRIQSVLLSQDLYARDGARLGLEMHFAGKRHFINSDRLQVLNLLLSTYDNAVRVNRTLLATQGELQRLNASLETIVGERTKELSAEVAEHRKAEEALRDSEARYRTLFEASADGILIADNETKAFRYANPALCRMLGYTEEELGTMGVADIHPRDALPGVLAEFEARARGEKTLAADTPCLRKDGTVVYADISSAAVTIDGTACNVGFFRDITEHKQAEAEREKLEAQFRQAQKMEAVGRLAGGVAHDFNNMLQVINSYAELALKKLEPSDPLRAHIQQIAKAGQRSADLTRQLLAFARQQAIAPKVLDLNDTVAGMLEMLRRLIGEDIDLLWKPADNPWPVKMDPSQIDQILANLTVNARDAIAGVGKITIETGTVEFDRAYCDTHVGFVQGQFAMLAVSDDGCGMDKETLARAFEPFFTTKPMGQGTGLGLATAYGIVKQNGGFINVYSEPGKGTTLRIYLPRHESEKVVSEETRAQAEAPTGKETVLLVEDEAALLELCGMLLEQLGYTVLATGSSLQAIQLVSEYAGEIHLLMTDVVMPEMGGRDLWHRLSEARPGLKCLFMSGYTANAIAHRGVLDEGIHFLQKPFSLEKLATKLREALSTP